MEKTQFRLTVNGAECSVTCEPDTPLLDVLRHDLGLAGPKFGCGMGQCDTVGHGHVPALRCPIDSLGADRLLLGTDFPYENGDTFIRAVDYIHDPQIDPSAARAILDQNASALLGIG